MFCPKCGNEIATDTKFCPKCGEQIVKEAAGEKIVEAPVSQKADVGKIVLVAVISLAVLLIGNLIVNKMKNHSDAEVTYGESTQRAEDNSSDNRKTGTSQKEKGGFSSYEDAIDTYYTAGFATDVEGVVECFPEEMQPELIQAYNAYRSGGYAGINDITADFIFINNDPRYEYSYELGAATEMDAAEIEEFETKYGLKIKEGYTVETSMSARYFQDWSLMGIEGYEDEKGYATQTATAPLKVAKIGKKWYLLKGTNKWVQPGWYEIFD